MKAQEFFGGTKPKATGVRNRQPGHSSATPGVNNIENNRQSVKNLHRKGVPTLSRQPLSKSRHKGKEDNRTAWR